MTAVSRVTQRMMVSQSLQGLESNQSRLAAAQRRTTSGKAISRPSDDPSATMTALRLRSEKARSDQWTRNAQDGQAWLGTVDTTLSSMNAQVRRVRELTIQGMNTGAMSATARNAIASEIDGLRQNLLSNANTTYLGRPLFGGTTSAATAYDAATGAYTGDSSVVAREVGDGVSVRVDVTGPEAFGPAGADLFTVLASIANDLRTNTGNLGTDLSSLDAVSERMTTAMADVGTRYNRIEAALSSLALRTDNLTASLSEVEDVDMARSIYDLNVAQVSYQAALGATAKVIQPSLMDFLR
jgi:flagellar hook-associated protein 3 FlgL